MAKRGLVLGDKVVQVENVGGDFEVHPSMVWVDGPDAMQVGWVVVGGIPEAPPPATVEPPPSAEEVYDRDITGNRLLRALVLALNDGSFVPGGNASGADIKAAILAKL